MPENKYTYIIHIYIHRQIDKLIDIRTDRYAHLFKKNYRVEVPLFMSIPLFIVTRSQCRLLSYALTL